MEIGFTQRPYLTREWLDQHSVYHDSSSMPYISPIGLYVHSVCWDQTLHTLWSCRRVAVFAVIDCTAPLRMLESRDCHRNNHMMTSCLIGKLYFLSCECASHDSYTDMISPLAKQISYSHSNIDRGFFIILQSVQKDFHGNALQQNARCEFQAYISGERNQSRCIQQAYALRR